MAHLFNKQNIGKQAEKRATQYLKKQGLQLILSNYHCRFGEIDLIMRDKADIVFVEVRHRSHSDYGLAIESINQSKMRKLNKTALHFLQSKNWLNKINSRFDVIAIQCVNGIDMINWVKNAFTSEF